MDKFVNPFTDYGFKLIFGTEINKDLLISFLNSVLNDEVIVNASFRNVEMLGVSHEQRRVIFDIFCENEKGEYFIVEMQKSRQKFFADRVLYYASMAIQHQAAVVKEQADRNAGDMARRWNYNIRKVYVVCILDYLMEPAYPGKFRWDIVRMDRELKIPFSETLNEIYLEMPKFVLSLRECDTIYKKWLYVLNNINIMERLPFELNEQIFRKLKSIVEVERMTADERLAYELSISAERDWSACLETRYEEGLEKGKAEGIAEGEARGKAEGRTEGKAEGKEEGKAEALVQTARKLKASGFTAAQIAEFTGLPGDEIEGITGSAQE